MNAPVPPPAADDRSGMPIYPVTTDQVARWMDPTARLDAHRAHGPADSLWGRCTVCGLTWSEQARAIQDEEKTDA